MNLVLERIPSPIGTILLVSDSEALRALDFEDHEERLRGQLRRHYGGFVLTEGRAAGDAGRRIAA